MAPLFDLDRDSLLEPDMVFQTGIVPNRIDIITSIEGVDFDEAWPDHGQITIEGIEVPVIGKQQLILNKRTVDRPKDRNDVSWLESE